MTRQIDQVVFLSHQIVLTCLLYMIEDQSWVYLSWLLGCLLVQGTLMSLFLYPLIRHSEEMKKMFGYPSKKLSKETSRRSLEPSEQSKVGYGIRDSNIFTVSTYKNRKCNNGKTSSVKRMALMGTNPMYRAARRCVVCASVAFVTDVLAGVFMIIESNYGLLSKSKIISMFLFDFNLVINSIFVVGCFANWRSILLPACYGDGSPAGEQYKASTNSKNYQRRNSL